MEADGG